MEQKFLDIFIQNCKDKNISYDFLPHKFASKVNYTCNKCNYKFSTEARKMIDHSGACLKCIGRFKTNEIVDEKLKPLNKLRLSDYKGSRIPFDVRCLVCQHEWKGSFDNLVNKKRNCPKCSWKNRDFGIFNLNQIKEKLKEVEFQLIDEYNGYYEEHLVKCSKCKHIHKRLINRLIQLTQFCLKCSSGIRKNERLIKLILNENKIEHNFNYPIKKLGSKRRYLIDFYFPNHKLFIEYNGSQHYEESEFFKLSKNGSFKEQIKRDKYVEKFLRRTGYHLIVIDGRDFQNNKLKNLMLDIIKKYNL